ncbi:hypothetical protein [uncultured Mucilaginibacter sp.]|uniref:hypothetical protein n=1 Tax=uncultured Mucilaginibacter sp. TaxID=797541 RepID=UPI0025DCD2BD|nr:hypothetical protein [uncultured Mucilaginibacter sp.]
MKLYLLVLLFIGALQYSRLGLFLTYDMVVKGHGGSIRLIAKKENIPLLSLDYLYYE